MAIKHNGFTLIELLVVVLIIGILAAVAVPQYQKAVERARASEALVNVKALVSALKVYKMANGTISDDLSQLDIDLTGTLSQNNKQLASNLFTYSISELTFYRIYAKRNNPQNIPSLSYTIYYRDETGYICSAENPATYSLCRSICNGAELSLILVGSERTKECVIK